MQNAADMAGVDAVLKHGLKIDKLLRRNHDFAPRQFSIAISMVEPFEDGARVQSLADQVFLSGIQQVGDHVAMVAHCGGPEIHDLREIQIRASTSELFKTSC